MNAEQRRKQIINMLSESTPLSASYIAKKMQVSRQVIVGDIALLRAAGATIIATPRGYILQQGDRGIKRQIVCKHNAGLMRDELYAIIDNNCKVVDVIVEHPVYGQLCGMLHLSSRKDVEQFIKKCSKAQPLSYLTDGLHLHTIICPDIDAFNKVKYDLAELNILLSDD